MKNRKYMQKKVTGIENVSVKKHGQLRNVVCEELACSSSDEGDSFLSLDLQYFHDTAK